MLGANSLLYLTTLVLLLAAVTTGAQTLKPGAELDRFERSIEAGRLLEIEKDLLAYVVRNRSDARGVELLARLRSRQGRLEEARSLSLRALALDNSLIQVKLDLADIELRLGSIERGRTLLGEISALPLSTPNRLKLARAYAHFGSYREALQAVSKLPPKVRNEDALDLRVLSHLELGEDDQATVLVAATLKTAGRTPATAMKVGEVLIATRFNREAIALLNSAARTRPQAPNVHLLLARAELFFRNFPAVEKHLVKAMSISPHSSEVMLLRAMLLSEQNDNEASLLLLEKALTGRSDPVPVLRQIAIVAMRAGRPQRSMEAARALISLRPDVPEYMYLYGAASLQSGRPVEAEEYLMRYAELRPKDTRACVALGIALVAQPAKVDTGQSRLIECLRLDPRSFEAAYQLGVSYKQAGESQRAAEMFERVAKTAPDFAPGLRELGTLSLQAGETAKARSLLEKAVVLAPNDANTHFQLSRLYNLLGEGALAASHFEKFRTLKAVNEQ